jgi:hypothetical protein
MRINEIQKNRGGIFAVIIPLGAFPYFKKKENAVNNVNLSILYRTSGEFVCAICTLNAPAVPREKFASLRLSKEKCGKSDDLTLAAGSFVSNDQFLA